MSVFAHNRGLMEEDEDQWHTTKISLPRDAQLYTLHTDQTFFVRLSGIGSRSVRPEAIMGALVAKGFIPPEVAIAQNIDWYMEEETGNRCFVVKKGIENILSSTDGADFDLSVSGPNLQTGNTVKVHVIHSSSKENTFRLEYVPYLANQDLVTFISSFFCDVVRANVDLKRKDVWWVTTTTPLKELPHWVVAENLVYNMPSKRLLVSVKDRDVQCFYCRETLHWTNQCRLKKSIEKEERQMFLARKKDLRAQEIQQAKDREQRERAHRDQIRDNQTPHRSNQHGQTSPPRPDLPEDPLPSTLKHAHRGGQYYPDFTPDADSSRKNSPRSTNSPPKSSSNDSLCGQLSPNSAQLDPVYSNHTSPNTPPSAQPPRRLKPNNLGLQSRKADSDPLDDSWQQDVIDALSPITRKTEIQKKLKQDLMKVQQRKDEAGAVENKESEATEQKQRESLRKQQLNENRQKKESIKKKEDEKNMKLKEKEDERVMEELRVTPSKDTNRTVVPGDMPEPKEKSRTDFRATKSTIAKPSIAIALFSDTNVPCSPQSADKTDTVQIVPEAPERDEPPLTSTPRPTKQGTDDENTTTCPNAPVPTNSAPTTPHRQTGGAQGVSDTTRDMTHPSPDDLLRPEGDKGSLLGFFSSDPGSGISRIINAFSSPKPGEKRANNLSTSHDDSKRPFTENSSLDWHDESLALKGDRNRSPDPDQSIQNVNKPTTTTTEKSDTKHP